MPIYVVSGLVDFDDVPYDTHSDLLYNLAAQVVQRLRTYLPGEEEVRKVLSAYQRDIARSVRTGFIKCPKPSTPAR